MSIHNGEFWDITANAFRGCSPASAGCHNCWALRMAWRHAHNPNTKAQYAGLVERMTVCHREPGEGARVEQRRDVVPTWTGKTIYNTAWAAPLRVMKKRQRVFLNGMGDFFHEANRPEDLQHALGVIRSCPQHLFIIITKRPAIAKYHIKIASLNIPNLILMASAENQWNWDERLGFLLDCKGHVGAIGVNCEPLIGHIEPGYRLKELDWLIAGGETGPAARFINPKWAGHLAAECNEAGVPFWFKQWGRMLRGRVLGGQEHNGGPKLWKTW